MFVRIMQIVCLSLFLTFNITLAFSQQLGDLRIAAGPTDSAFYPLGSGLTYLFNKSITHAAKVLVTANSYESLQLVLSGKADIAFAELDAAWKASQQNQPGSLSLQSVAVIYSKHLQLITFEGSTIKSVSDLKGKHVSLGPKNSETEKIANRLLEAAGLDQDASIRRENLEVDDGISSFNDSEDRLDAVFCLETIPTQAVNEYTSEDLAKIRLVDISGFAAKMNKKYGPIYAEEVIPNGTYHGFNQDIGDIAIWHTLVVRSDMPVDRVYDVVKALFENSTELGSVRKEASELKLQIQTNKRSVIPYHPGALKYYSEKKHQLSD